VHEKLKCGVISVRSVHAVTRPVVEAIFILIGERSIPKFSPFTVITPLVFTVAGSIAVIVGSVQNINCLSVRVVCLSECE
jgi:hypothetical protein